MAPELIVSDMDTRLQFSNKPDVFSFGVLIWSCFTGLTPYSPMPPKTNCFMLLQKICNGMRPAIPAKCPEPLVSLINDCWHNDPEQRPSFAQVANARCAHCTSLHTFTHTPCFRAAPPLPRL